MLHILYILYELELSEIRLKDRVLERSFQGFCIDLKS